MTAYPGDPKAIGINAPAMIFTASGGAGGRVIAWLPGGKTTRLWRGSMDGDVMGVAATRERVYVIGHYDHTVPDPNDPCLKVRDLGDGHYGVSCPDGTLEPSPRRLLRQRGDRWTGRTPASPASTRTSPPRPTPARARTPSSSAPTRCTSAATSPSSPAPPSPTAACE